jgi:hypothetical protein
MNATSVDDVLAHSLSARPVVPTPCHALRLTSSVPLFAMALNWMQRVGVEMSVTTQHTRVMHEHARGANPHCFFDVAAGGKDLGRIGAYAAVCGHCLRVYMCVCLFG